MRKGRPTPTAPPSAQPGTAMILLPEPLGDPYRLAEQSIEKLRREQPPRCVKTSKRKRKAKR